MPRRDDMAFIFRSDHGDYFCATLPDVLPSCRFIPVLLLRIGAIIDCLNTIIEPNVACLIFVLWFMMPCVVDSVVVVGFGGQVIELYLSVMLYFGHFAMYLKINCHFCYQNRGK